MAYHKLTEIFFEIAGMFPKKNLFFFESFHGRQYSDNPRAIYEYLKDNHPDIQCVWAVKRGFEQPFLEAKVPFVYRMGLRWLFTMPRAKYWVFNTRMPKWMKKTPGTIYLQTWHGTPLKRLGLDIKEVNMPGADTERYRHDFLQEASRWDFLISPNQYSSHIFRSAFGYSGEILQVGYPRNEWLMVDDRKTRIDFWERLGYESPGSDEVVFLYTPTWRDDDFLKKGSYNYADAFPFEKIIKKIPNCRIIVRTHYLISKHFDFSKYGSKVIDGSNFPDIRELFLNAHCLITDYSSTMFDFAYTERPMIFYMYDLNKYAEEIRGLYFDPRELPGPLAFNEEELIESMLSINRSRNNGKDNFGDEGYQRFYRKFCPLYEKKPSEIIVDDILLKK